MVIIPPLGKSFLSHSDVFSGRVKQKRDWKDAGKLQDFPKNLTANDGGKRKQKYFENVLLKSLLNLKKKFFFYLHFFWTGLDFFCWHILLWVWFWKVFATDIAWNAPKLLYLVGLDDTKGKIQEQLVICGESS